MDIVPTKQCSKCKENKPATYEFFSIDKRYSSGFYPSCKKCRSKATSEYNKAHVSARSAYDKEYRESHRDKKRDIDRRSKEKRKPFRKEILRAYWAEWRKKNPLKVKAKLAKAMAKRRGASGHYTEQDIALQLKSQKGLCWWCGKELNKYHIDHRIPLVRGGTHDPGNIVISCPICNLSKNAKMPHEWIGRLL